LFGSGDYCCLNACNDGVVMLNKGLKQSICLITCVVLVGGCTAMLPENLGVRANKLTPCPNNPNCVSSQGQQKAHYISPITYNTGQTVAKEKLVLILQQYASAKIRAQSEDYIHIEFQSRWLRFIDDVEFYFYPAGIIQIRSASRVGYSDFGVNRQRIEKIKMKFSQAGERG
jgi:uncharacterized protein (DUF1499 family)